LGTSFVLNACLTGMVPTKETNPRLPITPEEIVSDAHACAERGASVVHIHARDESGRPTPDKEIYREIRTALNRRDPELVVCFTTSGRNWSEFALRSAAIELSPDMASLTLGSMNFPRQASVNSPEMIRKLAGKMLEYGVKPELEVFEVGMVDFARRLVEEGYLEPPLYFNILLGSTGTMDADAGNLVHTVSRLPEGSYWSVAGIGSRQFRANCLGLAVGGGVRVGLEDNLWLDDHREALASNVELVDRIVAVGRAMQRRPCTSMEVRNMLNLPGAEIRPDGVAPPEGSPRWEPVSAI
jgi:3-keto-5-aminohexanoate cleavage enzyme